MTPETESAKVQTIQSDHINIWIIHSQKRILISDLPGGPPLAACSHVSAEAAQAVQERGYATVSEIGFQTDCHLQAADWTEAEKLAEEKAAELKYEIDRESWEGELAAALADGDLGEDEWAGTCEVCGGEFGDGWSTCVCDDEPDDDSTWWDDTDREEDEPDIYS